MSIQKLTIFNFSDIKTEGVSIIHQNAFIFPDGKFCLVEGYTGGNPSHQLEDYSLRISREILGIHDLKVRYQMNFQELIKQGLSEEEINRRKLYYLRDILVHYYGYGLFARIQRMDVYPDIEQYWDSSILPNPIYNGKTATEKQIETLNALFELNEDGTVLPSWNGYSIENHISKVLRQAEPKYYNNEFH